MRDRILVVENDPLVADLIARQALLAAGYQTQVVSDATTAISRALQIGPDAIIASLDLPGLSGKDLMVALTSQGLNTPVIVLARKGQESDIIQAFRLGAVDYMVWPLKEPEVINVIERVLRSGREHREKEMLSRQLQRTNQELQSRVRELTTIFAIGKAVTSITDQSLLFERILEGATRVTQADLGWFLLRSDEKAPFILVSQRGLPASVAERIRQPWDDGISSLVALSSEPLSIHGEPVKRFQISRLGQSALIVPIKVQKQVIGLLTVMRRKPLPFNTSDQHLLQAVADYAMISISNARLFRTVEERASSLENLAGSARIGEKINNQMLMTVKNQVRVPLAGALKSLEKIAQDPTAHWNSDQRQELGRLQEHLQALDKITEAILPPRIDKPASPRATALSDLVKQAVGRFQDLARENGLALTSKIPDEPLMVQFEPGHISQVLDSLLSNALKFCDSGGQIAVTVEKATAKQAHVMVSDSGPGLDSNQVAALFNPEGRKKVLNAQVHRFGGLGVNLALVKEIITQQKGKIWVESEPGAGTTIHFSLPIISYIFQTLTGVMARNQKETILVVISDSQVTFLLARILKSTGYNVAVCLDTTSAQKELDSGSPALLILGEQLSDADGMDFASSVLRQYPAVPIVLFVKSDQPEVLKTALHLGLSDYLCLPLKADDILQSVQNGLMKARLRKEWVLMEAQRATTGLQKRLDELEALTRLGRSITGTLDLDSVLLLLVDAAVELTGAEEGSLLLLDKSTGELYMRAARNFQEDFVRKFRLPIQDTLAGTVLRTGQPVILDEKTPQKIKTAYLVHSLAYVPLKSKDQVIGVLGVDNRMDRRPLRERDIKLLAALAEFAVIAIDNADLYALVTLEHNKLNTVLTNIQDGVIVIDQDKRMVFANKTIVDALGWSDLVITGRPYRELIPQSELLDLIQDIGGTHSNRTEFSTEDGRVFSALLNTIPEVGMVITMHDITNLKKLDRIKSDFVSTVSHDLRSPLTAILGYVELIERIGNVSDAQRDYIRRVQSSVHSITELVDDLLNLGRIEAGFDARKEPIQIDQILKYISENFQFQAEAKKQRLVLEMPEKNPPIIANPIQIRTMLENMVDNAIKYTPPEGKITLRILPAQKQIIIQVIDTGAGIPAIDLPYIFDKFYRASNTDPEIPGTGLGLAIVKSIVENNNGRIWVDSTVGAGSTFTVVLPVIES